jgi:peptide/nickel transport system substrate-binding protein
MSSAGWWPSDGAGPVVGTLTRAQFFKLTAAGGAMLFAPGLLSACGGEGSSGISWGTNGSISTLDLRKEFGIANTIAAVLAQDAVFNLDLHGRLTPGLGVKERRVDDKTYVYQLREGVKFSDGSPLTAEDVAASLTASAKDESAMAKRFEMIESIEASGELEITVRLKSATGLFRYALSTGPGNITSATFLERGDVGTASGKLLGTGPFVVKEFVPDNSITYEPNKSYWGSKPTVENVVLTTITDDAARLVAMQSRDLDGSFNVPSGQVDQWAAVEDTTVELVADLSCAALVFNTAKPPYDDVRVRRAIALCWDREGLVKSVLGGRGQVASAIPMPEQYLSVLPEAEVERIYGAIPQYDLDVDAAQRELDGSAVAGGFSDRVSYPSGYDVLGLALQALAENTAKIGITLDVREAPLNQWIEELSDTNIGLKILQTIALTPDPSEKVVPFYSPPTPSGVNYAQYRNLEVSALLEDAVATFDNAKRGALLGQALALAAIDVPYAPLWWPRVGIAMKDDFSIPGPTSFTSLTPWARDLSA